MICAGWFCWLLASTKAQNRLKLSVEAMILKFSLEGDFGIAYDFHGDFVVEIFFKLIMSIEGELS